MYFPKNAVAMSVYNIRFTNWKYHSNMETLHGEQIERGSWVQIVLGGAHKLIPCWIQQKITVWTSIVEIKRNENIQNVFTRKVIHTYLSGSKSQEVLFTFYSK